MGCVGSSNKSRTRRSESTALRSLNDEASKTNGRRTSRTNSSLRCVDVGIQTEFDRAGPLLLRRLSSRIKQAHRRSTREQRSGVEPPDLTLLFDVNRAVARHHSRVSEYINQALDMTGEQDDLDSSVMTNGSAVTAVVDEPVSTREKQLIGTCWKEVRKDLVEFGVDLFVRLLEQNPSLGNLFPFGKLDLSPESLSSNPDLRAHAQRVMESIGSVVDGLDDWELIIPFLEDLGARHAAYGATPEHFQPFEEAFMYSLKNGLPPKLFTSEVQEAWGNLWKSVALTMATTMRIKKGYDENYNEDLISHRDVKIVQGNWTDVQKDMDNIGASIFVRLFEKNPSIKDLFPFGKLNLPPEKLKNNSDLKAHAKGVMDTIGKAVAGLDDFGSIIPLLQDLGARHKLYGAKPEHFKPFEEAFMYSLKNGLPPKVFTSEVQEAWGNLWKSVAVTMATTMRTNEDLISHTDVKIVQGSWTDVRKDMDNIGASIFVRLLEKNPSIKDLFPFGKLNLPPEKLKNNSDLRAHAKGVMETISKAVAGLDDMGSIIPLLQDLGARHKLYGAKPEHFKPFEEAFMYSLKNGLSPKVFTSEVQEAWGNLWKSVAVTMATTMRTNEDLISHTDVKIVQGSWTDVRKDMDNIGASIFVRLLEKNPSIKDLFPFGKLNLPPEKLKNNSDLRAHAKGVMETISKAVAGLDDMGSIIPLLQDLGARHKLYGAKPEHFKPFEEAFMYSLKNGLSPKVFTSEVQEAWGNLWKSVAVAMATTMRTNEDLISHREVKIVQGSWTDVRKDMDNIGASIFVRLLEKNPSIKDLFPFGKLNLPPEKLKNNSDLRAHAKGVMETIGKAVAGLDDMGSIIPLLQDLGARHKLYGAKPEHFKPFEEAFMYSLKNDLSPGIFTSEVQEAWGNLWKSVAVTMATTMRTEEGYDENYNEDLLSPTDIKIVQGSWTDVRKNNDNIGATLFVRLLEQNPSIKDLFPFGKLNLPPEKLKNNSDLKAHAKGVMETIGKAVAGLDDVGSIIPLLEDVGARHKLYGAKPEHFEPFVDVLMQALKSGLPAGVFTSDVQKAWMNVLRVISQLMSSTMSCSSEQSDLKPISAKEKRLVQACWKVMQKDMVNMGATLFVRLLEKYPPIKELFPFGKLNLPPEKLKRNKELRAHGQRVMETMGAVVAGLDDVDIITTILEDLGSRHIMYGAKPQHLPLLQEAFMHTLKTSLPPKVFTREVQEAWMTTMEAVATIMNRTLRSSEDDGPISQTEKHLVRTSWKVIQKDHVNLGAVLFVRLLEKNPSLKNLFTFGQLNLPSEELQNHPDLRDHAKGVMQTIGMAVDGLDDLEKTISTLEDLGARHRIYGAKPQHFPAVIEAFMFSMKDGLSPKVFTSEVEDAWRNVLKVIDVTMSSTMRNDETSGSDQAVFSARDSDLVRSSWKVIQKDQVDLGAAMFVRLLDRNPTVGQLFPFGRLSLSPDMLRKDPDLRAHGQRVMETLGTVVDGLDNLEEITPRLKELGATHKIVGAKPEHFEPLIEAFMYSLKAGLKPNVFTSEVQEAWANLWKMVAAGMVDTME